MTAHPDPDDFDALLSRALSARPLPPGPPDLAQAAVARAAAEESRVASRQLARMLRLRRRSRLVALAATLLVAIGAVAVISSASMRQHFSMFLAGSSAWSDSNASVSTDSTASDSSSSSVGVGVILTAEGLAIAFILLSLSMPPGLSADPELAGRLFA